MEFWLIIWKLILTLSLVVAFIHFTVSNMPWVVFSFLVFLSINIAIYIVKRELYKNVLFLLSIAQIIVAYQMVQPLFLLLLPLNICELAASFFEKKIAVLVMILIPIVWTSGTLSYRYGLISLLSFVMYTILSDYTTRLQKQENQLDAMRQDLARLSKRLNENKEYIRQSEYTYKLEERNRLAQVFHDKIGHAMTGALIQMEAAKRMQDIDKIKAQELLQNAINISKEGIENIRLTLKSMKPPPEQMGVNRLKLFIDEFSTKHSISIPFLYKGNMERITPIQWKIIQENVTEALTNALKYSDATIISIELHVLNAMIKVEVKDNGRGADKVKKGLGIIGMEERTASINGTIIVDGKEGFTIRMLLPNQE